MSQYELLLFIQHGLNYILGKEDIELIIKLYKLSILVQGSDDDNYKKLFIINYIDYYNGRLEFILGVKNMSNEMVVDLKNIIISSLDMYIERNKKDQEEYKRKYEERKTKFLELSIDDVRNAIINELLSGVNTSTDDINFLRDRYNSISYEEIKGLENINIDFELEKIKGKRKHKYTDVGNFEDDDEVLKIIINNLTKRGYLSHHLHIHVYEELDNAINIINNNKNNNYKKIYQ